MNLVVIHLMDPLRPSLGGAVRHVLYLLKYFLERGYKITFIGTQDDKNYPPDKLLYEYYKSRKLSIIYLSRGYGVFKFFIGLVVASIMLDISPETIIHFHQPYFILPFILHRKCKLVLTLHALPLHTLKIGHKFMFCFFKPIYKLLEFIIFKRCNIVIFASKSLRKQYNKFNKAISLPGGIIDIELFKPISDGIIKKELRSKLGLQAHEYILLYVGRLEKVKRVGLLIEAVRFLIEMKLEHVKLIIIGEGNEMQNLIEKTRKLGLEKNVLFVGRVPPNEVVTFYNVADLLCLPSLIEVSPNVIKEAMAVGLPFITTVCTSEIKMFSSKNCGLILPSQINPQIFAEVIRNYTNIITTRRREASKKCRNLIRIYDYHIIMSLLEKIYLSMISQNSATERLW